MKRNNELTVVNSDNGTHGSINPDNYDNLNFNEMTNYWKEVYSKQSNENKLPLSESVARYDQLMEKHEEWKRSRINLEFEVEKFIYNQISKHTKSSYKKHIQDFIKYCKEKGLNPLKISVDDVDDYMYSLREEYASRSIRFKIASLSSFYNHLHLHHYDVIKINPFQGHKLPVIQDKYKKDYPTKKDFIALCEEFTRIDRPDYVCIVKLLYKYGWRRGILEPMELHEDGSWESVSKGKIKKSKENLTKTEYKQIIKYGILDLKPEYISSKIKNTTIKLFKEGKISCSFSAHDLRRSRMLEEFKDCGPAVKQLLEKTSKFHKDPGTF